MTCEEMFDFLVECGITTEAFVNGAVCVGGWNEETFERVLFYHTGYRSFEQVIEEMEE